MRDRAALFIHKFDCWKEDLNKALHTAFYASAQLQEGEMGIFLLANYIHIRIKEAKKVKNKSGAKKESRLSASCE